MRYLWLLIKKNLKLLIRSKSSALVIFFAPLLLILILGLSYNSSAKYGLVIGVYSGTFSNDVNSLIDSLKEQEFKIVKYDTSVQDCINDIKLGLVHTCVSVPSDLKIEGNAAKEVVFYIDPSKINLVWMVQQTLESKFNLKSQEISQQLAGDLLSRLSQAKTGIAEKNSLIDTAKVKSTSAVSTLETARQDLISIDFSTPPIEYDTSIIESFKSNMSSEVQDSLSKISLAAAGVDSANISASQKADIMNKLNTASESLEETLKLINGSGSYSIEKVSQLVSSMIDDLNLTKTKLSDASIKVSDSATGLSSGTAGIQESVSTLESVQAGLEEIKANLESQKITEAGVISSPLITKIEKINTANTYLNFMFPALLVLVIMFSSLLLGTTLVMMEKNSPAFFRNFFLPLKKATFISATYLTNIIIALVQIVIILGVSLFFLKMEMLTLLPIAGILILSASVFTFMGMTLGYLLKSEETGVLASISLGSFLLFISGVILPLESVSPVLRKITYFNPFVISEKIIREIFFFNSPLKALWMDLLILIGYVVLLFLITLIIETTLQKHFVQQFMNNHKKFRQKDRMQKNNVQ